MKLALLATLIAFAGSIAGFGSRPPCRRHRRPVAAVLPAGADDEVVVRGDGPDCPQLRPSGLSAGSCGRVAAAEAVEHELHEAPGAGLAPAARARRRPST